jgi:hypothetical protein
MVHGLEILLQIECPTNAVLSCLIASEYRLLGQLNWACNVELVAARSLRDDQAGVEDLTAYRFPLAYRRRMRARFWSPPAPVPRDP